MTAFTTLGLASPLLQALEVLGFTDMTPVQEHALPPILAARDVIAQARTGTGKTVAFGLGILAHLDVGTPRIQALVLCPTRELAEQVTAELRRLARFVPNCKVVTLCGGVPVRTQTPSLQRPPHIVVGTPGRILDHLRRETLAFESLRVLVLDEADRMLDMGFAEAINEVVTHVPGSRQTLLFSATYPEEIRRLSTDAQREPVSVTVDATHADADIAQVFHEVEADAKPAAVAALLLAHRPESALVFCHTKNDTRDVAVELARRGFSVLALHGDLEQRDRDEVLLRFANRSASVLVATDVAARGLDIKGLPLVIAYELPIDPDVHVHRIGRTGRAGAKGLAVSLVTRREKDRTRAIIDRQGPLRWAPLPPLVDAAPAPAAMVTLSIDGGRRDKLRPGDILGALTGDVGLPADAVGKIDIAAERSYVAVRRDLAGKAEKALKGGKIKGRSFRVRPI
jgi:ATP-independent RNA helicase DbpA